MIRRFIIWATFLLLLADSCTWENAEDLYGELNCPPEGASFSKTVQPIISANCAVTGCHITGQQLPALETFNQIAANTMKIEDFISSGIMPPDGSGKSLVQEEIDSILCWIVAGAPNY